MTRSGNVKRPGFELPPEVGRNRGVEVKSTDRQKLEAVLAYMEGNHGLRGLATQRQRHEFLMSLLGQHQWRLGSSAHRCLVEYPSVHD